ncbi:MAG: DnaJ domain-containing protein [Phycisphaeraceae bacterium]|nr:MAG: DnaJ domain-containing protein [Phycisphaeraceae bacterium]
MADRDLYDILGVDRGASQDEIRAAYRALARRLHPDVNKAPDAQARFTEVQEAYDVLSDAEKRRLYDRTGRVGSPAGAPAGAGGFDFSDLGDLGSVFDSFFGGRTASRPPRQPRAPRRGPDTRQTIHVDLEAVARGATVRTSTPSGEVVDVKIPEGCADGAQLRLRGRGRAAATPASPAGDLLLTVRVDPHRLFTRGKPHEPDPKSLDLSIILPVTIAEATFGATIDVPTLEGPVRLNVPARTSSGRRLRLRGRGLPGGAGRGDLYAVIRIVPPDPDSLGDADRAALHRIAERQHPPRSELPGVPA